MSSCADRWGRVLSFSLGTAISIGFARFAYGLILPDMRATLGWSYSEAGWINTANAIGYLAGALLTARFIGRTGPTSLFTVGMALTALAILATGFTHNILWLSIWRVLSGFAGAAVFIAGAALTSSLFNVDESDNALAIGLYFGGAGLGMLVSGASIQAFLSHCGSERWPLVWVAMGIASLIGAAIAIAATRRLPRTVSGHLSCPAAPPLAAMSAALLGYFLFATGYIVYLTFLVAWMRAAGSGVAMVSVTWSVVGVGAMASPFAWRSILARRADGIPLALCCGLTGFATLLPVVFPGPFGYLLSALLFGLSFFIGPTAVTTLVRKSMPQSIWGRAIAIFTAIFGLGQIVGPVVAGRIADASGHLSVGLSAAGAVLLCAAAISSLQRNLTKSLEPMSSSK